MEFVRVRDGENDPIEVPTEKDGSLLLSTLQAQFPGVCGLKYMNEETKTFRGVRSNDEKFSPPKGNTGWGTHVYYCVFPKVENKRKSEDNLENSVAKAQRTEFRSSCTDLIVLGLAWKTSEESLKSYFETYGEILLAQIKRDNRTGLSKGYGFIRFASYDAQICVLSTRHLIDGRWCEIKVPNTKVPRKVFVGRCTKDIKADDLRDYFSKFGEVIDVFIPRPFRAFSFVTFLHPEVAQSLCGKDHLIKGVSVHVSNATPKAQVNRNGFSSNSGVRTGTVSNYYGDYQGSYMIGGRADSSNGSNISINSRIGSSTLAREEYNNRSGSFSSSDAEGKGNSGNENYMKTYLMGRLFKNH